MVSQCARSPDSVQAVSYPRQGVKANVLILGAAYGSLLGTKLLLAGHRVTMVCTRTTAALLEREGLRVRFPLKGGEALVEIRSEQLPGSLSAATPEDVDPGPFDLVVFAMQEAQYGSAGVSELMSRLARATVPGLGITNMPPLPYLKRIPGLRAEALESCYPNPRVWDGFDPRLITTASAEPQAFRPPGQPKNVLQVTLPNNFKAARFGAEGPTAFLRRLEADIEASRFDAGDGPVEIPVKLTVHDSPFVPLAKWPMLLAGNYRCIRRAGVVSIKEAVHADLGRSRRIYDWVLQVCKRLGAEDADLLPFEKFAAAAQGLVKPSTAARALLAGAEYVERVDRLVRRIARQQGLRSAVLDEIITLVDERLAGNRAAAGSAVRSLG